MPAIGPFDKVSFNSNASINLHDDGVRINTGTDDTAGSVFDFTSDGKVLIDGVEFKGSTPAAPNPVWVAPTLLNGWANNGNTGSTVQPSTGYRKDGATHVELKGLLVNTASPTGSTNVFLLPVGFRPPYQCQFLVTGSSQIGVVKVNPSGYVLCAASDGYIQLTGIRFPIDS